MNQSRDQRLLAFDVGTRRIGVAVGQETTGGASALTTLDVAGRNPDWQAIARLLDDWTPDRLVVGYPRPADDGDSDVSRAAKRFARQLEGRFGLPVDLVDERLSTWEAEQRQRRANRRSAQKNKLDALAACVILESWYQQRRSATDRLA
jgi:putative Holliday junction resolvase